MCLLLRKFYDSCTRVVMEQLSLDGGHTLPPPPPAAASAAATVNVLLSTTRGIHLCGLGEKLQEGSSPSLRRERMVEKPC